MCKWEEGNDMRRCDIRQNTVVSDRFKHGRIRYAATGYVKDIRRDKIRYNTATGPT